MGFLHSLWGSVYVRAAIPVAAAIAGGIVGTLAASRGRLLTVPLVQFAAGAFFGLALLHLMPEAAEQTSWPGAIFAAAAGMLACALLARWAGSFCPACEAGHEDHNADSL